VSALADLRQLINALDEPQGETRSKALPPEVEHGQSDNESSASALGDGSGSSATVSLTNEQRRDLMAALAELLLSSLTESAEVRKGGEDADE